MGWILVEKFNVKIRSSQRGRKNGKPKLQYYKLVAVEWWDMEASVFLLWVQSLDYIIDFLIFPMQFIDTLKIEETHKLYKKYYILTPILKLINISKTPKSKYKI